MPPKLPKPATPSMAAAPLSRRVLLHSVSATALLAALGTAAPGRAHAGSFRSLNQALSAGAAAQAQAAAAAAGVHAAQQAGLGAQNVAAAATRFRSLEDALAGLSASGAPVPAIPDGVAPGGLQQAPGVTSTASTLWSGASSTLTQTLSGGTTNVTVTVTQTGPVASLAWQTFNIGAKTHLYFNQSAGGTLASSWVAINSVQDPLANPTTILGEISAPGKIYIVNRNGVLFGAGAQVDVGSLIAATATIAAAQLTHDANGLVNGFSLYGSATGTTSSSTFTPTFSGGSTTGSIVVQPGASIVTNAPSSGTTGGGYVMLLADTVQSQGVIVTPNGQTVLAAGTSFILQPGQSTTNPVATVIGSQIAVTNTGTGTALGTLGTATNSGIIVSDLGDVTMVGHSVVQDGVIMATTDVNTRGTVHLLTQTNDPTSSVILAPSSVTEVLPVDDGQTALNSQRASDISSSGTLNTQRLTPSGPTLNDYNVLPDTLGESRIEISTGGTVTMQPGALALAQGGQVALGAGAGILVQNGATIDVSGVNATLPASANSLYLQGVVPYYLRDSAANRTGGLEFSNIYLDERTLVQVTNYAPSSNGTPTSLLYSQGGLFEVSGNVGLQPHGIDEWAAIGGTVTLQSGVFAGGKYTGGTVTLAQGSTINLTGGTVAYEAGLLPQSYVLAADGVVYNANVAPGDLVYVGTYDGQVVTHPRWNVTQSFDNPLLTPSEIYQAAYTVGRDAGRLVVSAAAGTIAGTIDAGVTTGSLQTSAHPSSISDPYLLAQTVAPLPGGLEIGAYLGGSLFTTQFQSNILITAPGQAPGTIVTALPDSVLGTISVDGAALTADGLGTASFYTAGGVAVVTPVSVSDGGTITIGAAVADIGANLTAHAGTITLTNFLPGGTQTVSTGTAAIALSGGALLDASGEWTNLQVDPAAFSQAAYSGGGSISIRGAGGVDLPQGTVLDVSSGGQLSQAGKLTPADGGNITVSSDLVVLSAGYTVGTATVTYDATFRGYASATGAGSAGTLTLGAPDIVLGAPAGSITASTVVLDPAVLNTGFADYVLNGDSGITVGPGASVTVTRPIYVLSDTTVPSGAPASSAYSVVLPGLFQQNKGTDTLTQRAGAGLSLLSSIEPGVYDGGGGSISIAAGAGLAVDPGQSITVAAYGQVTDYGTLTAHGGTVTLANTRYEQPLTDSSGQAVPANFLDGLSVWIGDGALVDVSGMPAILADGRGRSFGQAQSGGTIILGGLGGANATSPETTYAQVILQQGAVLDASGASATVDVVPSAELAGTPATMSGPVTLSGAGGTIVARSLAGVALDGTMLASGSGVGAAGGALIMRLDPEPPLADFSGLPASFIVPSQILVSQDFVAVQPPVLSAPGAPDVPGTLRLGRISQVQIDDAGFDSVSLYAQDQILFDGNVDLHVGRSLTLAATILGETSPNAAVSVTVPYLSLFGYSSGAQGGLDNNGAATASTLVSVAQLTLNAGFIDIANQIGLGGTRTIGEQASSTGSTAVTSSVYGFAGARFNSTGDIRFDQDSQPASEETILTSAGNITFDAREIYPETEAVARVVAGVHLQTATGSNQLAGGTLTVLSTGAAPQTPYSVGGTLALFADTVIQDGIVLAPEGRIVLGEERVNGLSLAFTDHVQLEPGSVTSVSLDGETVPYGGTVDGVNYEFAGTTALTFNPVVQLDSVDVGIASGAVVDLRGGGTLSGAGFIAGRGGSADVNVTPLLNSGSGTVTSNSTDPVFAILPGAQSQYAPISPGDAGYSTPSPGEQISIAAGEVPGLAAGTYTLLPAYYDLLPGGYRVELTPNVMAAGTAASFGNFTTEAAVTLGIANTGIASAVPVMALVTPGSGVRQLSQYDEESYNAFEVAQAATFSSPRPFLPQDGKTLQIDLSAAIGTLITTTQPLSIGAGTVLSSSPSGGFGATAEITSQAPMEVLGAGDAVTPFETISGTRATLQSAIGLQSAMLDALDIPRLVLGGTLTLSPINANQIDVEAVSPDLIVMPRADLVAGDIMLTASTGTIQVDAEATLSTAGAPATATGLAQGYYFNSDNVNFAAPVVDISNVQDVFTPNLQAAASASIVIEPGASIAAPGGSLDFVAPQGSSVRIGDASLTAADVSVQVADINIASVQNLAAFASALPAGLTLDAATLQTLAQNARTLDLTASQAVNIIGSVALDAGSTDLVLNTPAIYGYAIAGQTVTTTNGTAAAPVPFTDPGVVTIKAPEVIWSGVSAAETLQTGSVTTVSAVPGGALSGGYTQSVTADGVTTTSSGSLASNPGQSLAIDAGTIVLGYGPQTRTDDQVSLDRLALGFAQVTLDATNEITANNQSSLSVWQTQATYGQPGQGGNLTLIAPLVTAASGAVLDLTAGGTLTALPGTQPANTASVATLGATIDLTATQIDTSTAFALPSGKLVINAQDDIGLGAGTMLDLSGRAVTLFDQVVYSTGGTVQLASATGGITEAEGAAISVSSPGAAAGQISATAASGPVVFDGTLSGSSVSGQTGGSLTVFAGSLGNFDAINTTLDAGGFTGARNFEAATGDITIDGTVTAHTITVSADGGGISVLGTGRLDASGATPGSIALTGSTGVTLESGAVLDAHATKTQVDSYGEEIDSENEANVTLGSPTGSVTLLPGATINVSYPDAYENPQGQIVIDAARNSPGAQANDIAVSAPGGLNIIGAASVAVYGFQIYAPKDSLGTIVQDNGTGDTLGSGYNAVSATGTLGLVQIGLDNQLFMNALDQNTALSAQMAGLFAYGGAFHLRPGVLIESSAATGGDLTISGDLDLSGLRYNDPAGIGLSIRTNANTGATIAGSGEPGYISFKASGDLTINGSVSDGFAPPPDSATGKALPADANGWDYVAGSAGGEVTNADLLLPAGAVGLVGKSGTQSTQIVLLATSPTGNATTFDTARPVSLNYAIVIDPANINANVVIPFALTIGSNSAPIPAGGWVATAPVLRNGAVLFARGALIPAGFTFETGDVLDPGSVLPISVQTGVTSGKNPATGQDYGGQLIPAGTLFSVFYDSTITLSDNTGVLPVNAFIPADSQPVFGAQIGTKDTALSTLELRPTQSIDGNNVQGYLYPLAQMLAPDTQSWSMSFAAGANLGGASLTAVTPQAVLNGGVFAPAANTINQAPGSLLIDDLHYYANSEFDGPSLAFSVIRTGTGDLSLVAGGDIDQSSLYGIYTAGTQALLAAGNNKQFDVARQNEGGNYLLPGSGNEAASALISATYQAYYPNEGGNFLLSAQGDVTGDIFAQPATGNGVGIPNSDSVGNWLWRQGSTQLGQPTAWWINFGTLAEPLTSSGAAGIPIQMLGFEGWGTLGGGNVNVTIGGNAGQLTDRDEGGASIYGATSQRGEGLVIAVGSTGRILPGTTKPKETGGGTLSVTIGGTLNPIDAAAYAIGASSGNQSNESPAVNGDIIDTRGAIAVTAGAIGRVDPVYDASANILGDPRALDPFSSEDGIPNGGIELIPGDATVAVSALRDLVIAGAGDPGRELDQNATSLAAYKAALKKYTATGGVTGFTLWQSSTSISLFSDGGTVTPTTVPNEALDFAVLANDAPTDNRSIYPPSLYVTAATGDIIYGQYGVPSNTTTYSGSGVNNTVLESLETMPAPDGQVSFLAGGSINANTYAVDLSGADPAGLSRPADPAFTSDTTAQVKALTNILTTPGIAQSPEALFALEADTPSTDLHAQDTQPARFYAAGGDLIDVQSGETLSFATNGSITGTWYVAAKPVWMLASQDIVSTGTRPQSDPDTALFGVQENELEIAPVTANTVEYSSGNLFLNTGDQPVSVIQAGRDILSAYAYVGGPGVLEVQAGRNLYQAGSTNIGGQVLSFGAIKSLGDDLITGSPISLTNGASLAILAGVGAAGPSYTAFADLYFNPANQANLSIPLDDPANAGKVQQTYAAQLLAWLQANAGYTGDQAGALAAFLALPAQDQAIFVRQVYFDELQASGTQEADPASPFYKSYARGRLAIDTLFPSIGARVTDGVPAGYTGGITAYSGTVLAPGTGSEVAITTPSGAPATYDGGFATLFGGTVQMLVPGGEALLGIPGGPAPGNNAGIVTYGSGDIDVYALGNVALGQSRIFTTAGGNITIWSSDGDINAGIGAKTTQVYSPPVLVYDDVGDVTDTPPSVTTGAGIATLQPLPDIPAGDVSLIAPLGTIDAGEAGIRVSGNLVLAAARIANTANITVKGSTTGAPTVTVASLGAVEAAGAAAGAAQQTAQSQAGNSGGPRQAPSVLEVEVVSIGGTYDEEQKRKKRL